MRIPSQFLPPPRQPWLRCPLGLGRPERRIGAPHWSPEHPQRHNLGRPPDHHQTGSCFERSTMGKRTPQNPRLTQEPDPLPVQKPRRHIPTRNPHCHIPPIFGRRLGIITRVSGSPRFPSPELSSGMFGKPARRCQVALVGAVPSNARQHTGCLGPIRRVGEEGLDHGL